MTIHLVTTRCHVIHYCYQETAMILELFNTCGHILGTFTKSENSHDRSFSHHALSRPCLLGACVKSKTTTVMIIQPPATGSCVHVSIFNSIFLNNLLLSYGKSQVCSHCIAEWNIPFLSIGPGHFRFKGCLVVFFIFVHILIEHHVCKQ